MVAHLHEFLAEHVRMDQHKLVVQLERDTQLAVANVLKRVQHNVVRVLVISKLLFLLGN